MRTSKEQINATVKAFGDAMHAARNYTNPDLTPEGLDKERERLTERARSTYAKEVDGHRSSLYLDRDRSAFDKYRPKLDWNKPADVAKAQSKWTAVQGKLDAGLSIGQVIESADATTLVAINEFYPDHAEAAHAGALTRGQQYEAPDVSHVHRAVDDRAADIGGHTDRSALQTSRQAAGLHAYADVTLAHLDKAVAGQVNGVSDLHAAISAQQAEAEAMTGGSALIANHDPSTADTGQEAAAVSE